MKKVILLATVFAIFGVKDGYSQDSTQQAQLSHMLAKYYTIKDALVNGNSLAAVAGANAFIKAANAVDYKAISEGNINALVKDATFIAENRDVNQQRARFVDLSNNLIALSKNIKLSSSTVYHVYCPMRKAYWLTASQEIRNPYYGSAMMSCGNVVATINP